MRPDDAEAEALKLAPGSRAQLAGKLLRSLDELTAEQHEEIWTEEAARRDLEPETTDRSAERVFKDLRQQLASLQGLSEAPESVLSGLLSFRFADG